MHVRSLLCLATDSPLSAAAASAQTRIQSMDELYAAAKKEGRSCSAARIKAEHVAEARGRLQPKQISRHHGQIHPPLDRADGAAHRSGAPRQPRELRRAQSHRAGRHGALDEAGLPRRGPDSGHRQDAARRHSIPTAFYAATSVTPMFGIYNTKVVKPGEDAQVAQGAGDRSEMEGQGRDLAPVARRHLERRR